MYDTKRKIGSVVLVVGSVDLVMKSITIVCVSLSFLVFVTRIVVVVAFLLLLRRSSVRCSYSHNRNRTKY